MATIIAAHDLSGVGRCSLTTALAVIPALGHTCHPLPTAVLSQQTAFSDYSFLSFTKYMPEYMEGWRRLGISPDMVYTGFLGDGAQAALLAGFIAEHPDALAVVDPVMGDGGRIYPCFDESFVKDMRTLSKSAHILLPNVTEFNLLTGQPPAAALPDTEAGIVELALSLGAPRLENIIITSAARNGSVCNLVVDMARKTAEALPCRNNGVSYSGTGDLFASVFCGLTASGRGIKDSAETAAGFVSDAIDATTGDPRYGVRYEPFLTRLLHL